MTDFVKPRSFVVVRMEYSIISILNSVEKFLGTALPKAFACKIEGEAQHVKELNTARKDRLRVVSMKKVPVNACDPESLPLVESKLVTRKCSSTTYPREIGRRRISGRNR